MGTKVGDGEGGSVVDEYAGGMDERRSRIKVGRWVNL
jgi:hypothetical protein